MHKFFKVSAVFLVCIILLFSLIASAVSGNEGSFTDVTPDMQFFDYIEAIYAEGITTGYTDGTFGPDDPVTRGQMAAFIARALELPDAGDPDDPSFTDVIPAMQFFGYIEAIYAEGITTGYDDGTYRPLEPVNRGQMAAFLARALGLPDAGDPDDPSFTDVIPAMQFFGYIEALYAAGITTGYDDGTYRPNDPVTRGQMAAFLARAFGLVEPEPPDVDEGLAGFVHASTTDNPAISGATVTDGVNITTTNPDGFFALETPPGFKELTFSAHGYFDLVVDSDAFGDGIRVLADRSTAANALFMESFVRCELGIEARLADDLTGADVVDATATLQEWCEEEEEWINMSAPLPITGDSFGFYNEDATPSGWVHDQYFYGEPCSGWIACPINANTEYRVVVEKPFWEPNPRDFGLENATDAMHTLEYEFTTSGSERLTNLGLLGMDAVDDIDEFTLNVTWATGAVAPQDPQEIGYRIIAPDGETILSLAYWTYVSESPVGRTVTYTLAQAAGLTMPSGTYYVIAYDSSNFDNALGAAAVEVTEGVNPTANMTINPNVDVEIRNVLGAWNENPDGQEVDNHLYRQVGDTFVYLWSLDGIYAASFDASGEAVNDYQWGLANETLRVFAGGDYVFEQSKDKTLGTQPFQNMVISGLVPGGYLQTCIGNVPTDIECLFDVAIVLYNSAGEEVDRREFDVLIGPGDYDPIEFGTVEQGDDYYLGLEVRDVEIAISDEFDITEWESTKECIGFPVELPDQGNLMGVVRDASDFSRVPDDTVSAALYSADTGMFVGWTWVLGGDYSFTALTPGDYVVVFRGPGAFETKAVEVTVTVNDNFRNVELTPGGAGRIELSVVDTLNRKLTPADVSIAVFDQWTAQAMSLWDVPGYSAPDLGIPGSYYTGLDHGPDGEYRTPWALSASTDYSVYICDAGLLDWPDGPAEMGVYVPTTTLSQLPMINGVDLNLITVPLSLFELDPGVLRWNLELQDVYSGYDTVVVVYDEDGNLVRRAINPAPDVFTGPLGLPNGTYTVEVYVTTWLLWSDTVTIEDAHKVVPVTLVDPLPFR